MKIKCLQLSLSEEDNQIKITESINEIFSSNKSIDLIVLSELAVSIKPNKEKSLSTFLPLFSDLAKRYDAWLIPGTFHEFEDDVIYNTCPVINNEGELVAKAKAPSWLPYENQITPGNEICTFGIQEQASLACIFVMTYGFRDQQALAMAGAELIIDPTLTPTQDREIETVMVEQPQRNSNVITLM